MTRTAAHTMLVSTHDTARAVEGLEGVPAGRLMPCSTKRRRDLCFVKQPPPARKSTPLSLWQHSPVKTRPSPGRGPPGKPAGRLRPPIIMPPGLGPMPGMPGMPGAPRAKQQQHDTQQGGREDTREIVASTQWCAARS
jgi:hypothetical protein